MKYTRIAFISLMAGCSTILVEQFAPAKYAIKEICEITRDPVPDGLSGITYVGGNRYLSVEDSDGMLHELEIVLGENGEVNRCVTVRSVHLEGRKDVEGCAYDPLENIVWVADERDTSITAYSMTGGVAVASAPVPEVFKTHVRNCSLESLAITPDGLKLYTANEDTLSVDGERANMEEGGVVRIQEFVREGRNRPWRASRQFRYHTEPVEGESYKGRAISGVSDLVALNDGTLFVLEREMSKKNPLFPTCRAMIFEIDLNEGLSPTKRFLWGDNTMFANYEGMCLGPKLADGSNALLLISDGDKEAVERLMVLSVR